MAKNKKEENKLIYFILIVFIMFVFIIIAEVIIVNKYINRDKQYELNLFSSKMNNTYYNTDDLEDVKEVELTTEKKYVVDVCGTTDPCNIKINNYYIVLSSEDGRFYIDVAKNNELMFTRKIGTKLENTAVFSYDGNVAFYNVITSDSFVYDYLLLIGTNATDEFISLESNEIELTEDGVIYYVDECNKPDAPSNANKVKLIRKPFSGRVKEIDRISKNYPWCSN